MSERLVLLAIAVCAASGAVGFLLRRDATGGQWIATSLAVIGSGLGLAGSAVFWIAGDSRPLSLSWSLPGAAFDVGVDGLSAFFLVPVFLVSLLGNVYGLGYWRQRSHPTNGAKLRLFYGTLTAGMALLVIARNGVLFLLGWEIMALSNYFLVTTESHEPEAREAGWIYLVATHVATLCIFATFASLHAAVGSFDLDPSKAQGIEPDKAVAIFVLGLLGFGLKAGIMPLHVWLPSSHAAAPSHVSAMMSGVVIKMGIYGLVRLSSLLPPLPLALGGVVLALGAASGVLGVAFAIGQHDIKRLLAYHSIENVGIIVIGFGLAMIGRTLGRADLVILGLAGSLLHVWNHALFKSLLFLCAGSTIHAVHTREIDRLGGLSKTMPWTSFCFLIGAVAICGLPPLNGFVSELLIYLGAFGALRETGGPAFVWAGFAAPALALIGGLAVACFVKVHSAVFLGLPRTEAARDARESPRTMLWPMAVLVACCVLVGCFPLATVPALGAAVSRWAPEAAGAAERLASLAPLGAVALMAAGSLAAVALVGALLWARGRAGSARAATWGCGYVLPTPRMQYTSSSFAQMLVGMFGWALRPIVHRPSVAGPFPAPASFHSEVPDVVLDRAVVPGFRIAGRISHLSRFLQRGSVQAYLLYVFLALIALLLWARAR
jgi:hydrogenase-4 component B